MKKHLLAVSVIAALTISNHAKADQINFGNAYIGLGGGLVVPATTNISVNGGVTGSGNVHYKDGYDIKALAGYHFNQYIAGETELNYARSDYDHVSGSLTGGGLGVGSGSIGINGHVSAVVGLLNALITPINFNGISPYVGGGIGVAYTQSDINSGTFRGLTYSTGGYKNNRTKFAADGLIGADVALGNGLSLGGRYQYVWINSSETSSGGTLTAKEGNSAANVFTLQGVYHF